MLLWAEFQDKRSAMVSAITFQKNPDDPFVSHLSGGQWSAVLPLKAIKNCLKLYKLL